MHPLRAYRKARKISLDEVVRVTKLSKATISRIETRKSNPSTESLTRLCKFTDGLLSPNDFFLTEKPGR